MEYLLKLAIGLLIVGATLICVGVYLSITNDPAGKDFRDYKAYYLMIIFIGILLFAIGAGLAVVNYME